LHAKYSTFGFRLRASTVGFGVLAASVTGFGTAVAVHAATASGTSAPASVPIPFNDICGPNGSLASLGYTCVPMTSTTTSAPASGSSGSGSGSTSSSGQTLNSVSRILYSMDGPYEAPIADVPTSWSWGSHPVIDSVSPPSGYSSATAWGTVYANANFANSEPAQGSVRVELKNIEMYFWSNSQQRWVKAQGTTQVGGEHYVDNFANNSSIACDWQSEPDGGLSSALILGYNVHFWPTGSRATYPISASDIGGVYTTVQARLIGANVGSAHYLLNVGGDWWQSQTAAYPNNSGIGVGRYMALSGSWAAYNFWTGGSYAPPGWSDAQMSASNPPVDAMGLP
jgi:hypothetical protein